MDHAKHLTPPPPLPNRLSYHARWRRLGLTLEGLRSTIHSVTHSAPSPQRVEVHVKATLACHAALVTGKSTENGGGGVGKTKQGKTTSGGEGKGTPLLAVETTYVVYGSGDVRVQVAAASLYGAKQRQSPLHLPRLGLALQLPKAFSEATWLGLGPHECYADRKSGARVGVHAAAVEELHTPYVVPSMLRVLGWGGLLVVCMASRGCVCVCVLGTIITRARLIRRRPTALGKPTNQPTHVHSPGENGGRADVRWAALRDPSTGAGLLLRAANGPIPAEQVAEAEAEAAALAPDAGQSPLPGRFHFNAGMHSVAELERASHTNGLPEWEDGECVCLFVCLHACMPPHQLNPLPSTTTRQHEQPPPYTFTSTTCTWASAGTTPGSPTSSTRSTSSPPLAPGGLRCACPPWRRGRRRMPRRCGHWRIR